MATRGRPRNPEPSMRSCVGCGDDFRPNRRPQRYCSEACALAVGRKRHSENSLLYTRRKNYFGYWEVKIDGVWIPEARHVFQKHYAVKLPSNVYVGFRDQDKDNLAPDNLFLKNPILDEIVRRTGKLPKLVGGKPPKIKRIRPPRPRTPKQSTSTAD